MTQKQFLEITEWQNKTFGKATALSKINHLTEEVEELKDALFSCAEISIQNEFADCFILLFGAAASYGYNYNQISEIIDSKMQINYKRKWGKPDENGIVNHLKQEDK